MINAKSLALEILAHQAPVNRISLKQYRELQTTSPKPVIRQRSIPSVQLRRSTIFERSNGPIHVRITRVLGHPIVEKLGLKVKSVDSRQGHVVENLQPIRPFWMHVAMKEELGRVIATVVTVDTEGRKHTHSEKMSDEAWRKDAAGVVPKHMWTKEWVNSHPWLIPESHSSSETLAADPRNTPYFKTSGDTRVGPSLVELANQKHQYLTDISKNWLRRSLTNEMAWFRLGWRDVPELTKAFKENKKFRPLSPLEDEDLKNLMAAPTVGDFCSSTPIARLLALSAALADKKGEPTAKSPTFDLGPLASWLGLTGRSKIPPEDSLILDTWIGFRLEDLASAAANFGKLRGLRLEAAELSLTSDTLDRIHKLETLRTDNKGLLQNWVKARIDILNYIHSRRIGEPFPDPNPGLDELVGRDVLGDAKNLIEPLNQAYEDWKEESESQNWRRLTRKEARQSIDELEEAQVPLEAILSAEWENNGWGMRWKLQEEERPDHSLPVSSIGPDRSDNPWPSKQGLSVWPDQRDDRNIWEFVARKKEPKKPKARKPPKK